MRLGLIVLSLVVTTRAAGAGPCASMSACHSYEYPALADETVLPRGPWVAINVKDMVVSGTSQANTATPLPVIAKIDGKRVPIAVKDVHSRRGMIRLIHIKSRRKGKLELFGKLWKYAPAVELIGTYRIAADAPKVAAPVLTLERALDPLHAANTLALEIDAPAISFTLTWKRSDEDDWHVEVLEASANSDGHSMALIDDELCGGGCSDELDVKLEATLADGRTVSIEVPSPLNISDP